MAVRLKPVEEQVIVIVGASSGIGLATARMAAERGAKVVLAARNEEALHEIVQEIKAKGGEATAVAVDTSRPEDLERLAQTAINAYGGFDTWINNAAVTVYGKLDTIPLEDHRRIFEVNYWGVVNGSTIAARHLRNRGGAIINTGSILSERAMIYQTPYSATKHALKGFTDGFRAELEADGAPISVTLIKPSAIDTPYPEHARNYLDTPGLTTPPPAYDPHVVGKAMLFAAENQKRELTVGFGGWAIVAMDHISPRLVDTMMELTGKSMQTTDDPGRRARHDNLYRPREDGAEYSSLPGGSRKTSLFLEAQMRPLTTMALIAGVGFGVAQLLAGRGGKRGGNADRGDNPRPSRDDAWLARQTANGQGRPSYDGYLPEGVRPARNRPVQPRS